MSQYWNARLITIFFLGFSSGLPLALTGSTLQAWFAVSHIDVVSIGMLSLVGQPYAYKFIWAPLMDRYIPPILGRRRGWMLLTQAGLLVSLLFMASFNPNAHMKLLAILALLVAFLSASQDIALDAYRVDVLKPEERGLGAAVAVFGYRIAMIVSGGVALIIADFYGWPATYMIMSLLMLVGVAASWFAPATKNELLGPTTLRDAVIEPFRQFLNRKHAVAILVFIFLYKLGEAFTSTSGPLTSTFLLQGLDFSLTTVGTVNKGVGLLATLLGVFLGGYALTRISLYQALMAFGILQAISNLTFLALAVIGKSYLMLVSAVAIDNLCAGMGTAAVVALLMSLCDSRYSATQFALLSSVAASARIFIGPIAGLLVKHIGWVEFFVWSFLVCIPALILLFFLQNTVSESTMDAYPDAQVNS